MNNLIGAHCQYGTKARVLLTRYIVSSVNRRVHMQLYACNLSQSNRLDDFCLMTCLQRAVNPEQEEESKALSV